MSWGGQWLNKRKMGRRNRRKNQQEFFIIGWGIFRGIFILGNGNFPKYFGNFPGILDLQFIKIYRNFPGNRKIPEWARSFSGNFRECLTYGKEKFPEFSREKEKKNPKWKGFFREIPGNSRVPTLFPKLCSWQMRCSSSDVSFTYLVLLLEYYEEKGEFDRFLWSSVVNSPANQYWSFQIAGD